MPSQKKRRRKKKPAAGRKSKRSRAASAAWRKRKAKANARSASARRGFETRRLRDAARLADDVRVVTFGALATVQEDYRDFAKAPADVFWFRLQGEQQPDGSFKFDQRWDFHYRTWGHVRAIIQDNIDDAALGSQWLGSVGVWIRDWDK